MASSCVPASAFESPRRALTPGDLEGLLRRRRVLGLAEMMNFPGIIAGSAAELEKLGLAGAGHVDGHAPGVLGRGLQAYAAAGIRVRPRGDHARGGPRAAPSRDVGADPGGVGGSQPGRAPAARGGVRANRLAFCTDDRDPDHIVSEGHLNSMVRAAVAAGIDPKDGLVMASHHAAVWHGLGDRGAVALGISPTCCSCPTCASSGPRSC